MRRDAPRAASPRTSCELLPLTSPPPTSMRPSRQHISACSPMGLRRQRVWGSSGKRSGGRTAGSLDAPFRLAYEIKHSRARSVHVADGGCPTPSVSVVLPLNASAGAARHAHRTLFVVLVELPRSRNRREYDTGRGRETMATTTHEQLVILGRLHWAVLGQTLDDLDSFLKLGL